MAANPAFAVALLVGAALLPPAVWAQAAPSGERAADPFETAVANAARTAQPAEQPARLVFANRTIVEFRATVLSRTPATRAAAVVDLLERLVNEVPGGRVETQSYGDAIVVRVDRRPVFVIFAADVDPLAGEQLAAKASDAAARLQLAFDEAVEVRTPRRLIAAAATAIAATILFAAGLWLIVHVERRVAARLGRTAERQLLRLPGGEALARVADTRTNVQRALTVLSVLIGALLAYAWLAVVLRRFPYTRPWGESLRGALFSMAAAGGRALLDALPSLFTVLMIVLLTRLLTRLARIAFLAIEQERITLPWIHPDTAPPTRRIVVALLWLFALVVSYPYLPGSQSEVFKGVSVFVGLIVSLGSTGVMNQLMSGLMVTYSRALRCGDFVKVGTIEGTVTAIGSLATKITTPRNEEVTIPNAVVVSNATTNYSRNRAQGVYASTSVTIGYDTPWRQVQALLLVAAKRTAGVLPEPKPVVLQVALQDFYVEYMLFVALEQPHRRYQTLDALHAHIQDAFNEYGVQIMSPRYVTDPRKPKIVPPEEWYSAPAAPAAGFPSAVLAADRGRGA